MIRGKTFSLFGNDQTTVTYYQSVSDLVDKLEKELHPANHLLFSIRRGGGLPLSKQSRHYAQLNNEIIAASEPVLQPYLTDVERHLHTLTLRKRLDKTLRTKRKQYFLHMIEIELVNRLNREQFKECDYRLAFLPHCLRDLSKQCRAVTEDDIDYVCRRCSKTCFVRQVTDILQDAGVRPYIWMNANLHKLFRRLKREGKKIGVFGMACLPELVNGMRLCSRAKVPVVGIPLNANRCARWMGAFYDNSVDVQALRNLLFK